MKIRILKNILTFCFSLLIYVNIQAQKIEKRTFGERFIWGGNFSFQFGTVTDIEVSPIFGYYITPKWAAGIGGKYEFYQYSNDSIQYKTNIYGGKVFTNYILLSNMNDYIPIGLEAGIFAHTEYEVLSLERKFFDYPNYPPSGRFLLHSVLVGGGLRFPIGKHASFDFMALWNLNETPESIYPSPILRFGFMF